MKRLLIAAGVAGLLLGLSPSPATADATVRNFSGSAEVSNMLARGCDEYIRFSGTVRFVFVFVSLGTDTGLRNIHFVDANLSGVGETSGTTYRLVSISGEAALERDDQLVAGTWELTLKIFGGGQIYTFKTLTHLTVTPDGELTAAFSEAREDGCSA